MPHKYNGARRYHIGKTKFKVTNWREYEAGLRRRGSMTLWITPDALAGWAAPPCKTRGGQPLYSDLAIETTLMLGMVFGLRLRQSEGLLSSVLDRMGLDLPVPDHTTLSRRARTEKPLARATTDSMRRTGPFMFWSTVPASRSMARANCWKKSAEPSTAVFGENCTWQLMPTVARLLHCLTDQETGDASQLEPLLDQIDDATGQLTADGAYDGALTYDAVLHHSPDARIVVPPRSNAVERPNAQASCQRDDHIASMHIDGRLKWQASTGYGKRALVETAMGRYQGVIGPRLRARSSVAQQTETAIGVAILNRMLACGRPKSVRCKASAGTTK
jgi:hypothetical protein